MTAIPPAIERHLGVTAALAASALAALLAVAAISLNEPRILLAPVALGLMVVVLRLREITAIKLLIVMLAVQGFPAYFTGYFPTGTLFVDDAVALVLVGGWVARTLARGQVVRTLGATGPCLVLLAGYMAASMIFHRDAPWESELFAAWQIAYLWPVGFIAASALRSQAEVHSLLSFVWRLAWIEVAVVALQWPLLFAAGYFTAIPPVDNFGGTLGKGAAHVLGIWITMMIVLAVGLRLHRVITTRQALVIIPAFLFVLISGSTRQMYVVLPAAIAVLVAVSPLRVMARVLLIIIVPIALLGFFRAYSIATQMSFSVQNLLIRQQQHTRLAFYTYSWNVVRDRDALWFGTGPGSFSSTAGLRFGAPLAKQAQQTFPHDPNMVSATQWPVLLVELGVAGTIAVFLVFTALAWRMLLIARRAREPLTRGLALGALGAVLVLVASGFGSRSFEYLLPSLHVWLLCGLTAALAGMEREAPVEAEALAG